MGTGVSCTSSRSQPRAHNINPAIASLFVLTAMGVLISVSPTHADETPSPAPNQIPVTQLTPGPTTGPTASPTTRPAPGGQQTITQVPGAPAEPTLVPTTQSTITSVPGIPTLSTILPTSQPMNANKFIAPGTDPQSVLELAEVAKHDEQQKKNQKAQHDSLRRADSDGGVTFQFLAYPEFWSEPIILPSKVTVGQIRWAPGMLIRVTIDDKEVDPSVAKFVGGSRIAFMSAIDEPVPTVLRLFTHKPSAEELLDHEIIIGLSTGIIEKKDARPADVAAAYVGRGWARYESAAIDEALADTRKGFDMDPTSNRAAYHLGTILLRQEKYDEARTAYLKALSLGSPLASGTVQHLKELRYGPLAASPETSVFLGWMMLQSGDKPNGKRELNAYLRNHANGPLASFAEDLLAGRAPAAPR